MRTDSDAEGIGIERQGRQLSHKVTPIALADFVIGQESL